MPFARSAPGFDLAAALPLVSRSARVLSYVRIGESYRKFDVAEKTAALPPGPPPPARLFTSDVLNQSIILKMVDARLSRRVQAPEDTLRTIVYLPFQAGNEGMGGAAFDLADPRGQRSLRQTAGGEAFDRFFLAERDEDILNAVEALPSVDPFLLRDAMERIGVEVHETYFDLSDEQWQLIREYVVDHFGVLARRIYPDDTTQAAERAKHLADALWRPRSISDLAELANVLRVEAGAAHDMLHAWKGLLYYKLSSKPAIDDVQSLRTWLAAERSFADPPRRETQMRIDETRAMIERDAMKLVQRLMTVMQTYDRGFASLTDAKGSAKPLLDAIQSAPAQFHRAGCALGTLRHGVEVWRSVQAQYKRALTLHEYVKLLQLLAGIVVAPAEDAG
jgi:hypothetical protein